MELLVVITIIGILIALLLPAVQAAREAARKMQCGNHIKEASFAALNHESTFKFFPTGGWGAPWLGHPDRGFDKRQPGGWIYNILPYIEQQPLHDLGAGGIGMTIQAANAKRIATPLSAMICPSRRPVQLFDFPTSHPYFTQFRLTNGYISQVARGDYAMNGGDCRVNNGPWPPSLAAGDSMQPADWNDMSPCTGISFLRSQITVADITDGTSNTFLIGEKGLNPDYYINGVDWGDSETLYCGDEMDLLRWTGVATGVAPNRYGVVGNLPMQDRAGYVNSENFGSAHASGMNMSFCDGSVQTISYEINPEVYRRLGNRRDGFVIDGAAL